MSKRQKKDKKQKTVYIDDGHTVYSMENLPGGRKHTGEEPLLEKKERRAAIRAAFAHYLPILFMTIGCFAAVGILLYFRLTH